MGFCTPVSLCTAHRAAMAPRCEEVLCVCAYMGAITVLSEMEVSFVFVGTEDRGGLCRCLYDCLSVSS